MSQRSIQILTVSQVTLPPLPQIPSPIKLSIFDSIWIGIPPIQRLMLYSNPNVTRSSQSLAELLKSSLSATLVDYLPLAGTLTHVPSTGDVEIDFSDLNVSFYEAEADFDIRRLTASEIHDAGIALGDLKSLGDLYDVQSIATLFLIGIVSVTPTLISKNQEEGCETRLRPKNN